MKTAVSRRFQLQEGTFVVHVQLLWCRPCSQEDFVGDSLKLGLPALLNFLNPALACRHVHQRKAMATIVLLAHNCLHDVHARSFSLSPSQSGDSPGTPWWRPLPPSSWNTYSPAGRLTCHSACRTSSDDTTEHWHVTPLRVQAGPQAVKRRALSSGASWDVGGLEAAGTLLGQGGLEEVSSSSKVTTLTAGATYQLELAPPSQTTLEPTQAISKLLVPRGVDSGQRCVHLETLPSLLSQLHVQRIHVVNTVGTCLRIARPARRLAGTTS
eukprot:jgi/Bigna1/78901/fgenesh1_pg.58_\